MSSLLLTGAGPTNGGAGGGPSNDTSAEVTINGVTVSNGALVDLVYQTSVEVIVTPNDPAATVGPITGNTGMTPGNNDVEFDITAADGVTVEHWTVTVFIANPDPQPEIFQFDFSGVSDIVATFNQGGEGKYVSFSAPALSVIGVYFLFDGGAETSQPSVGMMSWSAAVIPSSATTTTEVAQALASAIADNYSAYFTASSDGPVVTVENLSNGDAPDASASGAPGVTATVIQQGIDA